MEEAARPARDSAPPAQEHRVVVAVDGDEAGVGALRWTLTWLEPSAGVLRLLVVETPHLSRSHVEAQVRGAVAALEERPRAVAADAIWWTATAPARPHALGRAIVERLAPSDLLVLGSDRSTRMEGLADTSLPLYIAASASSPVIVVPLTWERSDRVVLLVGPEDDTDGPLRFAAEEALRRGAPLELAHVWQVAPGYPPALAPASAGYPAARTEAEAALARRAERARHLFPGLPLTEHLLEGPRVPTLLPLLRGAGLAVVARHGTGVLRDVVLGSLAHELVVALPCPLAVVPSGRERRRAAEQ